MRNVTHKPYTIAFDCNTADVNGAFTPDGSLEAWCNA
jgi:hypothetical protein